MGDCKFKVGDRVRRTAQPTGCLGELGVSAEQAAAQHPIADLLLAQRAMAQAQANYTVTRGWPDDVVSGKEFAAMKAELAKAELARDAHVATLNIRKAELEAAHCWLADARGERDTLRKQVARLERALDLANADLARRKR